MIYLRDADFTLYNGDALEVLSTLPSESVDCVITSPPYWGLRDYSTDGQLGLEPTPEEYVTRMVEVFREVRRVLAAHGTCWVNMGDSYANSEPRKAFGDQSSRGPGTLDGAVIQRDWSAWNLASKQLVGMPFRLAFALQADGWYLRSDIVWSKPNPMPESVTDRPTKAHEYVFLLSKQPRYFFDQEAVRQPHLHPNRNGTNPSLAVHTQPGNTFQIRPGEREGIDSHPSGRNIRSVWEIATQPFPEAHFATFPEELVRRCLLAGCPEQVCGECGEPRTRVTSVNYVKSPVHGAGSVVGRHYATGANNFDGAGMPRLNKVVQNFGFTDCGHNAYRPGIVLDPFLGSGTVALVARKHGRRCVGSELNPEYCEMISRRTQQLSLLGEVA